MNPIYRVHATEPLRPSDPLHVGNFYSHLRRTHRRMQEERQNLVLYLAQLHSATVHSCAEAHMPPAMAGVKMRLTSLREWVPDYRVALDHFFEVKELGYNLGEDGYEISTLVPRPLKPVSLRRLRYQPPTNPGGIESKVFIQQGNRHEILRQLSIEHRTDLAAACEWLLDHAELTFTFQPAGRLQQRDTSVHPISAVETWPSWLRELLFGPGIDIESAYTQYLIKHLEDAYNARAELMRTLYPDLLRSIEDKAAWRRELCTGVLGLDQTDDNLALVKKICMSLANGSRISPSILTDGRAFSITAEIIVRQVNDLSESNLARIGERLQQISRQYVQAKKVVCAHLLRRNPTRMNQKAVFADYFRWERQARYKLWEAVGRCGIMVHDGIDGVPPAALLELPIIAKEVGARIMA